MRTVTVSKAELAREEEGVACDSQSACGCLGVQFSYGGVDYPEHGNTNFPLYSTNSSDPSAPAPDPFFVMPSVSIPLSRGEYIAAWNGSYGLTRFGGDWFMRSLAFRTSLGRILGPFGKPNEGYGFVQRFPGKAYSFYGLTASYGGVYCLNAIGAWTDAASPPPAPPFRPPPPPRPAAPSLPQWNNGRTQTYMWGYNGEVAWDDGPFHPGALSSHPSHAPANVIKPLEGFPLLLVLPALLFASTTFKGRCGF